MIRFAERSTTPATPPPPPRPTIIIPLYTPWTSTFTKDEYATHKFFAALVVGGLGYFLKP